jgi:zinc protease
MALDLSRVGVYASPRPGVELPRVEQAIEDAIAELAANGVTPGELERSKTRLIADSVFARDSQVALARWYGSALTTGSTMDDVRTWPDRIRAVTAEAVQDAARKWLSNGRSVTGYLVKELPRRSEKRS